MKRRIAGRMKKRPGLHIYEFNMETNEIMRIPDTKEVQMMEKCLYRQTLNAKAAVRKLTREGVISKEDNVKYITR